MINLNNIKRIPIVMAALTVLLALSFADSLVAQEGHPLNGTWSGDRIINGDNTRVLLILSLQPNQVIEGTLIENGMRIPLTDVTLNPMDWTVSMKASGKDRAGNTLNYEIEGVIENLGSTVDRAIVGTWDEGNGAGSFRVVMN